MHSEYFTKKEKCFLFLFHKRTSLLNCMAAIIYVPALSLDASLFMQDSAFPYDCLKKIMY